MAKNPDHHKILAFPGAASSRGSARRRPAASGANLQKASAGVMEPLALVPASLWPPVDEDLDEPGKVSRWERGDPSILEMKRESEERGRAQGKAEGRADSILTVLSARGFVVSEELRERIRATADLDTLDRWLRGAACAAALDEVFDQL